MKLLLIKAQSPPGTIRMDRLIRCEPLELEYLYTVLRRYDPYIIDGSERRYNPIRLIRNVRPDIVLFTGYIIHVAVIGAEAAVMKRLLPNVRIFAGGVHAEVCPEHFDLPEVDGVFFADHAAALVEVIERVQSGKPFDDVPGLAVRKGTRFVRNRVKPGGSFFPLPERVLFNAAPER